MSSHLSDARPNIDLSATRETSLRRYVLTYRRAHEKLGRYLYRLGFTSTPTPEDDIHTIADDIERK